MSDETNNPDPADVPETQPPTGTGGTSETDDAPENSLTADVPETQPPR